MHKKRAKTMIYSLGSKWCLQELNQGHMDFQSIALPTELRHLEIKEIISLNFILSVGTVFYTDALPCEAAANLYPFWQ